MPNATEGASGGLHVLVTGAAGFVGQALATRLTHAGALGGQAIERLSLADIAFARPATAAWVHTRAGSIAEPAFVQQLFKRPVDLVFHLASVPGGLAEQQYALGRDVNLQGTQLLLEACKAQVERRGQAGARAGCPPPTFVFASSIAVYGAPMPPTVDDATPLRPQLSYGAQKVICEVLVTDFSRRGWIDGRAPRLPGVLARPPAKTGQLSAFLSDLIHMLGAGRPMRCPTSPGASTWASSIGNVVDNLLHAATVDAAALRGHCSFTLPTLHFTMAALVDAIGTACQAPLQSLVSWAPDARIEALFGRYPPLVTALADAAGFRRDDDLVSLVRRAHDDCPRLDAEHVYSSVVAVPDTVRAA